MPPPSQIKTHKRYDFLLTDSVQDTQEQSLRIDLISLPLALVVLTMIVRSWRVLIFPLFCVGTTMLLSFALMYGVTSNPNIIQVPSFVPSLMEAIAVAMNIDYSLFILSRFRDEIYAERSVRRAIYISMSTAGHVVLMSGSTLFLCFLGISFIFPVS